MKKKLFTYLGLAIISLFVGFTQVRAENQSNVFTINTFYDDFTTYATVSDTNINNLKTAWFNAHGSNSDYIIYVNGSDTNVYMTGISCGNLYLLLNNSYPQLVLGNGNNINCIVSQSTMEVNKSTGIVSNSSMSYYSGSQLVYESSIPLYFKGGYQSLTVDKVIIPSYTNSNLDVSYPTYELFIDDEVPTYSELVNGSYDTYATVNVHDYNYVILSLIDYDTDPFYTNIYIQGRLCLTPVYNYGMTPRQEILTGTQIQGCTITYDVSTPINVSIIQSDIDNHAVYYVKAYQNETTIIKYDTRVFNISYINSSNASNPTVTIDGRSYPVIPYSDLTDTANISTDTGYISGQVCNPGDVNCASTITGIDISDLWTSPLQLFKTVGNSITSVLGVITVFITFLPPTLQAFLYTAFFLVIILGILKILL